jgi:hypothetical protein
MSDDTPADQAPDGPRKRIRGAARRLLEDPPTLDEAKELLGTVLDGSDRARTELVRMVGREVRTYMEGLGIQDGLKHVAENYSLEVNASLRLKPLKNKPDADE